MSKLRCFNIFIRPTLFGDDEIIFSYKDHIHTIFDKVSKSAADGIKYLINENKELKKKLELLEGKDE